MWRNIDNSQLYENAISEHVKIYEKIWHISHIWMFLYLCIDKFYTRNTQTAGRAHTHKSEIKWI